MEEFDLEYDYSETDDDDCDLDGDISEEEISAELLSEESAEEIAEAKHDSRVRRAASLSVLALLLVCTSFFYAMTSTFAADTVNPNATVTYSRNTLTWTTPTSADGIGDLNLFGDAPEGEALPLIHPYSSDSYTLRIRNTVSGKIGYRVYLYNNDPHGVPLKFNVRYDGDMQGTAQVPEELYPNEILCSFSGEISGGAQKTVLIEWLWDSVSDEHDTELGNKAALKQIDYTVNMLVIIEDGNYYAPETDYLGYPTTPDTPSTDETDPDTPAIPDEDETDGEEDGEDGEDGEKELPTVSVESPSGSVSGTVTRMEHASYMTGYPDGEFKPENDMTRAEAAAIFARILVAYDEDILIDTSTLFNDISNEDWFSKYISRLEDEGIVTGYRDGEFKPEQSVTRAEFATMAIRLHEKLAGKVSARSAGYKDISAFHWAKSAIDKAYTLGFMIGYPDGTFKPERAITRAEVVTVVNRMLARRADKSYIDAHFGKSFLYTDVTDSEYWAFYEIYEASNDHVALVHSGDGKKS